MPILMKWLELLTNIMKNMAAPNTALLTLGILAKSQRQ
jgi:hypothetical protein